MNTPQISNLVRDAALFDAAADFIERYGWIQGAFKSSRGVCTVGALMEITSGDEETDRLVGIFLDYTRVGHVPLWNDDPRRTKEQVVYTLRSVAFDLRRAHRRTIRMYGGPAGMAPRMGEIGEPNREIEFEPMPATEPVKEPARTPVEEPEKVPA